MSTVNLPTDRLFTLAGAAEHTGLSVRTLRHARDRYGLPVVKVGGASVRIRERDLTAWLDAQTQVRAA